MASMRPCRSPRPTEELVNVDRAVVVMDTNWV